MNSVSSLQSKPFSTLSIEEKLTIKRLGRPTPTLNIVQSVKCKSRSFNRSFNPDIYDKNRWLCGCDDKNAFFCFPCLLFDGEDLWAKNGVIDLIHLLDKMRKHENSKTHMKNAFSLALLGTVNVAQQLNSEYRKKIALHNEQVKQNRYVLNIIINCIRFCGAFELALRGHDESESSLNPGIFRGLINFSGELDSSIKDLEKAIVFKGTSKSIQNEILKIMLEVCQEEIKKEIEGVDFISVIADETGDVSNKFQMVVVLRYIVNGKPVERFWTFLIPEKLDAKSLASCIMTELERLGLDNHKQKVISQTYDGALVMGGCTGGVQAIVKQTYSNAEYIHCHAHQLNLVMQNAASINRGVRVFFADLQGICTFFSTSSQRTALLDEIVKKRMPRSIPTRWNFNSRSVNVVFEYKEQIIECLEAILDTEEITNSQTISLASGHIEKLNNSSFTFWLSFFHKIMPHVEILFAQLQTRDIDAAAAKSSIDSFEKQIHRVRNGDISNESIPELSDVKRRKVDPCELSREAKEICDVIISQINERFKFTGHLVASQLFQKANFEKYDSKLPDEIIKTTCEAYHFLNSKKLETELSTLYSIQEFRSMAGAVSLLQFIIENEMQETMSETVKLLNALITIPMTSTEAERCFSTLKRIKTFLRNTMTEEQERLSALAMLSIEKHFIAEICNFNEKVIDRFSTCKSRRIYFLFK